jgi:hypothetical protein
VFNLDALISVDYRVNSTQATQFRDNTHRTVGRRFVQHVVIRRDSTPSRFSSSRAPDTILTDSQLLEPNRLTMRIAAAVVLALVQRAGWAPITVFLIHAFLSRALDGYTRFPPLDIPMHLLGGAAIAYFFSSCFAAVPEGAVSKDIRWLAEFLCVATLTATAAVFWEFAEFASDRLFGTGAQKGLEDTLLDMALGIVGGVLYLLIAWQLKKLGEIRPLL